MNSKVTIALQMLLGLALFVFGLNKFMNFMPMGEMPEAAGNFMAVLATAKYMPILGFLEMLIGALLLTNKYVALALVLLAPLSVNFLIFHIFLAPAGIVPALIISAINLVLLFSNKEKYKTMLQA